MEKISVAIRVRPPIKQEFIRGNQWRVGDKTIALYNSLGTPVPAQSYVFDHVFSRDAKNADIYGIHTKDVILSAVQGFNGTVFAYGQTSSGKTYTMRGSDRDPGIIHRAICDVFAQIENASDREYLVRVSYMEIYKEEINDLLAPENRKLRIHENAERGIFVAGLREEIVGSPDQVFSFLKFGEANRHFGKTNMNIYSSRSHTIFRMVIESRGTKDNDFGTADMEAVRVSTLNMVDLAGSERVAKTGAGGVRLREGTHINRSLMTLGTVINKLSDGHGKGGHIPYRDSKLTRILQSALDGNAKTAVICTITPDEMQLDETRGTLLFASRAKRVTTCAQVNETITDAALLKRQQREIEELRQKLQGARSEILEKEILNLRNDLLKFELERERLNLELEEEKKAQMEREIRIKEQERKIENLSTLVISSAWDDRKASRKSNRRETWCPRWASPKSLIKEHKQRSSNRENGDSPLVSIRRDTDSTLIAFETLLDDEADTCSTGITKFDESLQAEVVSVPSDFENIADEDTWISMNKGSVGFDVLYSSHSGSSAGSASAGTASLVEFQMSELQRRFDEMKENLSLKESELEKTRLQLITVVDENKLLQNRLSQEMQFRKDFDKIFLELQQEVTAGCMQTAKFEDVFNECQSSITSCINDFRDTAKQFTSSTDSLINSQNSIEKNNLSKGLKLVAMNGVDDGLDFRDRYKVDEEYKSKRSGRSSPLLSRLLEVEETEKHLRQILQHSMGQLLDCQKSNNILLTENTSLVHHNSKLQNELLQLSKKVEAVEDNMRDSENIIKELTLVNTFGESFEYDKQSNKIKSLEAELAAARLEIVELKVDAEVNCYAAHNTRLEDSVAQCFEIEKLKCQCEMYEEELKLILEQLPSAEDELEKDASLLKLQLENSALKISLRRAQQRVNQFSKVHGVLDSIVDDPKRIMEALCCGEESRLQGVRKKSKKRMLAEVSSNIQQSATFRKAALREDVDKENAVLF